MKRLKELADKIAAEHGLEWYQPLNKAEDSAGMTAIHLGNGYSLHHEHSENGHDIWAVGFNGERAGTFMLRTEDTRRGKPMMAWAGLEKPHRGKGIGTLAYKALAVHYGGIDSDKSSTSDEAVKAWVRAGGRQMKIKSQFGKPRYTLDGDKKNLPIKWNEDLIKGFKSQWGGTLPDTDNSHVERNEWWHGTPSGRFPLNNIHVGSKKAAHEALTATIGHPVEGEWDGTREYGKTLLAGKKTLEARGIPITGYSVDAPLEDHYPTGKAAYSDGTQVSSSEKPNMLRFKIKGKMTSHPHTPRTDMAANAIMKRKGIKQGIYYVNEGEDPGSISAVVPSVEHLEQINNSIKKSSDLNTLIQQAKARLEGVKKVGSQEPRPMIFANKDGTKHGFVTVDPSKQGQWRVTHFVNNKPAGHTEAPTFSHAIKTAHESGYNVFKEIREEEMFKAESLQKDKKLSNQFAGGTYEKVLHEGDGFKVVSNYRHNNLYHGSPNPISKFSASKGVGQLGAGLYLAHDENTGRFHAQGQRQGAAGQRPKGEGHVYQGSFHAPVAVLITDDDKFGIHALDDDNVAEAHNDYGDHLHPRVTKHWGNFVDENYGANAIVFNPSEKSVLTPFTQTLAMKGSKIKMSPLSKAEPLQKSEDMSRVSSVVVSTKDKVLMLQRRDNKKWTFPGGHLNDTETHLQGAVRELWEEAGIRANPDEMILLGNKKTFQKKDIYVYLYMVSSEVATTASNDPDKEAQKFEWIPHIIPKEIEDNLHIPVGDNASLSMFSKWLLRKKVDNLKRKLKKD